jgi:hypothetical protein
MFDRSAASSSRRPVSVWCRLIASFPMTRRSSTVMGPCVPPTQHISGSQIVEERWVGGNALAFKDSGCTFRERHITGVKVGRPGSREYRCRIHSGNPTPPLPGLEPDSLGRRLRRVVPISPAHIAGYALSDGGRRHCLPYGQCIRCSNRVETDAERHAARRDQG